MDEGSKTALAFLGIFAFLGLTLFFQADIFSVVESPGDQVAEPEASQTEGNNSETFQASTEYTDTFEGELGSEYVFDIETVSIERQDSRNDRFYYRSQLNFELTEFGERVLQASSEDEVRNLVQERFTDYPEREGFEENLINDVEAVNDNRINDIPVQALTGNLESIENSENADAEIIVSFEEGESPEIKWGSFSTVWTMSSDFSNAPDCTGWWDGENPPYQIENIHDLQCVNQELGANYELAVNIDASPTESWNDGKGFKPIGEESSPFTGIFNGNGKSVSGLSIDRAQDNDTGLFGYVESAEIHSFGIYGAEVNGNKDVGGLVGYNDKGLVEKTYFEGSVAGDENSGGLVGYNDAITTSTQESTTSPGPEWDQGSQVGQQEVVVDTFTEISTTEPTCEWNNLGVVKVDDHPTNTEYIDAYLDYINVESEPSLTGEIVEHPDFNQSGDWTNEWSALRYSGYEDIEPIGQENPASFTYFDTEDEYVGPWTVQPGVLSDYYQGDLPSTVYRITFERPEQVEYYEWELANVDNSQTYVDYEQPSGDCGWEANQTVGQTWESTPDTSQDTETFSDTADYSYQLTDAYEVAPEDKCIQTYENGEQCRSWDQTLDDQYQYTYGWAADYRWEFYYKKVDVIEWERTQKENETIYEWIDEDYVGGVRNSYSIAEISSESSSGTLVGNNRGYMNSSYGSGSTQLTGLNTGSLSGNYLESTVSDLGSVIGLQRDQMKGIDAESNMGSLDFNQEWETVNSDDGDVSGEGFPILQAVDREPQLRAQAILQLLGSIISTEQGVRQTEEGVVQTIQ